MSTIPYIGRFAPSPTGPLHFGSLLAATGSYLHARGQGGRWLVRMEDLDTPRVQAGAERLILDTLQAFGFRWDDEVMYQSGRQAYYAQILARLQTQRLVFACTCPRRRTAGRIYDGRCRDSEPDHNVDYAWRLRTDGCAPIVFDDELQRVVSQDVAQVVGDFIVKRRDGLFAYQLAVVADDAAQGITHVVRGADLLHGTPRQIYLQQVLDLPTPAYSHLPVLVDAQGNKLSKQTFAPAIDHRRPVAQLWEALRLLGQAPPAHLREANLTRLWEWALTHWDIDKIPRSVEVMGEG